MRLYVASSWRNEQYPEIVELLKTRHEVYDFRHPTGEVTYGRPFSWAEIDPDWQQWAFEEYRKALRTSPVAGAAFATDYHALSQADAVVLVQPCGISSHLEAAFALGAGKPVASIGTVREPELMLAMVDAVFADGERQMLLPWAGIDGAAVAGCRFHHRRRVHQQLAADTPRLQLAGDDAPRLHAARRSAPARAGHARVGPCGRDGLRNGRGVGKGVTHGIHALD